MLRETDGVQGKRLAGGRIRPSRAELDPAALELLGRYGPRILKLARRFSLTPEDAEDAYQRGVEILLTKAPSTSESELLPWLRTVVKHEAIAIRRQRDRVLATEEDGVVEPDASAEPGTHDRAERLERLRLGAEALARLKPQEVRCLLLKAEGHSYKQIQKLTGYSYTKVDRCLKEGRRSFARQVAGIESGAECERLAGPLSRFADAEASAKDLAAIRPHLRTCLACRARLREYRAAPARVAALVPVAAVVVQPGGPTSGGGRIFMGLHDRLAEIASAGKIAAVAASTLVVAGGGTVAVREIRAADKAPPTPAAAEGRLAAEAMPPPLPRPDPTPPAQTHDPPAPAAPARESEVTPPAATARHSEPSHEAVEEIASPAPAAAPAQAPEFEPGGGGSTPSPSSAPSAAPRSAPAAPTGGSEFGGP